MSFNIGENVGPYRIVEQLGSGGMATVCKAYRANLDRYVAIKVLHPAFKQDPNFLSRFQCEARIVAKLQHPAIVPVYDFNPVRHLMPKSSRRRTFMLKRLLLCLGMLGLAGCTSNGNTLDPEVALILKLIVVGGFLVGILAAIAVIVIKESSERRVAAGLVALGAVLVSVFFVLVLVA
jgi:serine/threonine protein kinase